MRRILTTTAAVAMLAAMSGAAQADFSLTILHYNDFHSRYEPITGSDSTCAPAADAAGECFGGMGRLKAAIEMRRAALAGENVILLNAGDDFQGSLFYTTYKSEVINEFNNQLGIDVFAVGNHEFDDGPEELARLIEGAEYPIISGNTMVAAEPVLAGKLPAIHILEIAGERIAIISALAEDTIDTSSPGANVRFANIEDNLTGAVQGLEAAGINKIIALTHAGFPRDQRIAAAVPGIDVIVGGHSHTVMSNTVEGAYAYPLIVTGPMGNEVPVVTAGAYAKYLGELHITWDDDGKIVSAEGDTILLGASVTPDSAVVERLAALGAPIEELKNTVIGNATAPIDGSRDNCRARECQMGNLVAEAILDRTAGQGISIVIQNGGGLRASVDQGDITMGEVLTVLPFSNTLATMQISGADVIAALENGLSQVEDGAGRFPQVAGLKYTWTRTRPAGDRVINVQVKQGDQWVPIDEAATYGVATNNYMRNGGDGYAMFVTAANPYDFGPPLEQVLADYIAGLGGDYTPFTDGRISEVQ